MAGCWFDRSVYEINVQFWGIDHHAVHVWSLAQRILPSKSNQGSTVMCNCQSFACQESVLLIICIEERTNLWKCNAKSVRSCPSLIRFQRRPIQLLAFVLSPSAAPYRSVMVLEIVWNVTMTMAGYVHRSEFHANEGSCRGKEWSRCCKCLMKSTSPSAGASSHIAKSEVTNAVSGSVHGASNTPLSLFSQ